MAHIAAHKPPIFILENVKALSNAGPSGKSHLDVITDFANSSGYHLLPLSLNAASFGCPAVRDRYYLLGVRVAIAFPSSACRLPQPVQPLSVRLQINIATQCSSQ